ncbi:DUF6843 domain-containing protein [Ureibacillus sp. FSL W8-0352]|uniref:DUF6843 domain-containing protein n=1 Tax=Ureibacillus sp. FSL W8-0352 TaxID=2954596 RepID=UPI0030FBBEF9
MKKFAFGIVAVGIVIAFAYWVFANSDSPDYKAINYYLPESFKGCAVIVYDQVDAPALTISDDKEVDVVFDENGVMKTSSPSNFGWQSEGNSGFHKSHYFSGGELLAEDDIYSHNIGSIESDKTSEIQYEAISVKVKDACQAEVVAQIIEKNVQQ